VAIRRRGAGDIWQGLWEPYLIEDGPLTMPGCRLIRQNVRHVLTHQVLLCDFYLCEPSERPVLPGDYIWVGEQDLDDYALPRLVEKLLGSLPVR
jgi:A/G-specific adenine glycosylase